MITIELDKKLDNQVFSDFWGLTIGGADFGERGIARVHPKITEENANEYIDSFYAEHADELEAARAELQTEVDTTAPKFLAAVTALFGPKVEEPSFTGKLSIFDCNPRFVDTQSFQVFYQRDLLGKLEVVFHESMHFLFFAYAQRTCPEVVTGLDVNGGSYWALSEILNVIFLNRPEFQEILQREEQMFYPMLAEHVEPIRDLYERHPDDMCTFLREALKYLDSQKG
jgi:hypothetical protein